MPESGQVDGPGAAYRRAGRVAVRVQVYHRLQGQGNPGRTGPVRIAFPYLRPEVVMGLALPLLPAPREGTPAAC